LLACLVVCPAIADEGSGDAKSRKPKLKVGARLHALWVWTDAAEKATNEFSIDMARVSFRWQQFDLVQAKLQADLDQLFGSPSMKSLLRDAWVQVAPFRWLRFRLGQFKRPFSRLELRSRGKLATVRRGLANGFLVEELGFGDRDLGLQLDGRVGSKDRGIRYAAGIFNGSGKNADEHGLSGTKDVVARFAGTPVKWLSLGASGSLKFFDRDFDAYKYYPESAWMAGADLLVKHSGFRFMTEGMVGRNYGSCFYAEYPETCRLLNHGEEDPLSWSLVVLMSYKFDLCRKWKLKLQPVLKGELFEPETDLADGKVRSFSVGTNLFITKYARLMIHGEFIFAGDGIRKWFPSENRMLVQLAFDI